MSTLEQKMQARTNGEAINVTALRDQVDRPGGGTGTTPRSRAEMLHKVDNG